MDDEKLDQGLKLRTKIADKQEILNITKNQKAEVIIFTYGDGSDKAVVCNDLNVIEDVRSILIAAHETKLAQLKEHFDKL